MGLMDQDAETYSFETVLYAGSRVRPEGSAQVLDIPGEAGKLELQQGLVPQASHLLGHVLVICIGIICREAR